jgi:hypothetical protein
MVGGNCIFIVYFSVFIKKMNIDSITGPVK